MDTLNGATHVTTPRVSASYYNVPVGTELDIKYDPDDPDDSRRCEVNGNKVRVADIATLKRDTNLSAMVSSLSDWKELKSWGEF